MFAYTVSFVKKPKNYAPVLILKLNTLQVQDFFNFDIVHSLPNRIIWIYST